MTLFRLAMPWENPEINTFIVQPPFKDRSQIIIYLNQLPRSGREEIRLFGLAEIKLFEPEIKNDVQIFLTRLATKFQESHTENPALAFEQSLEWANRVLRENFEQRYLPHINLLFGCLKNNNLQFATLGLITTYIFFKEKNNYKNLDLLKTYTSNKSDALDLFFSNLISGELHRNNFVLFSTPTLLDFLTVDRLEKIITQTKTSEICSHLETILNQIENKLAFGGILIAWPANDWQSPVLLQKPRKITPDSSIRQLIQQEQETAKILSPSLFSNLRKAWQSWRSKKILLNSEQTAKADLETLKKITKIYTRLNGWQGQIKIWAQKTLITLGKLIFNFFLLLKNLWRPALLIKSLKQKIRGKFLSLPPKRRWLLVLSASAALLLIISLTVGYFQKASSLEKQNYNQIVNNIKNKLDETESSLIYKNEDQALLKLKEIKTAFELFPQNSTNRKQMYEKLFSNYQILVQKIQHFQTVSAQLEIGLASTGITNPTLLLLVDKKLISTTNDKPNLGIYDLASQKFNFLTDAHLNTSLSWVLQKDDTVLILNDLKRLVQFNPKNNSFELKEITWTKPDSEISLIVIYGTKLYALDAKYNQISKHAQSTTGFGKGEFWINPKEELKLSDTSSLAVDGNIYIGKNNGEIWKLEKGQKINFDLSQIDPPLNSPIKLFTKTESTNLFILEPQQKRIIIWNKKTNRLTTQLTSSNFKNLKNLTVDEKTKKIYLIDGQNILSIKY